ncbi:MAG: hypothetical protein JSS25_02245 [Proteobacteria bacterium]|nr:hypothetical protein [Pseudomonadota bacterium]
MNHNDRRVPAGSTNRPHVERRLDFDRFPPLLRQALMYVEPAFFGWEASQQDRYRRDMPDAALGQLEHRLGVDDSSNDGPGSPEFDAINKANALKLPLFGIGADCFWLNEHGSGWYDMETIADLSQDHYQADPEREENKLPFMGQFYPSWCRYLRQGQLVYATLTAFHHYVGDELARLHDDLIGQLIPHRFVKGSQHGKKTDHGYLWDMQRDANGLEEQLDELQVRAWKIQSALYLRALDDCHARSSGQVFRVVESDGSEAMTSWVFDGIEAMRGVRLMHFLDDVDSRRASRRILAALLAPYRDQAEQRLRHEHKDIMHHWDPKLAKLKPRRQVVLSEQAASHLLDE